MRVLVTGASGFIGRALVAALARQHEVRAATRSSQRSEFADGVEVVRLGDMAKPIDWTPLLAGIDAVVHLAGIAHTGPAVPDTLYDQVNHRATAALAKAAAEADVKRFVLMSSVRAQTGPAADHVLGETDAPCPTDAYGRSKLAAETALRASGVPFTILRPVLVYGPGVKGNLRALARLAATPLPLPFGSFANRRSLLARSNLVDATAFVLENPATLGELYLVADPKPVTLAELLSTLRRGLGRRPGLLPVPPGIFASLLKTVGRDDMWNRVGGALVASSDKLAAAGWRPKPDTMAELTAVAVSSDSNERDA